MNKMIVYIFAALGVGIALGQIIPYTFTSAVAATNAVVITLGSPGDAHQVAAKCDFSKSIAVISHVVVCQEK